MKTLLFIHGFPMNKKIWADFIPKFQPPLTPVAIDLPGFGLEPLPAGEFSFDELAEHLHPRLKDYPNPILVGHSMGGYVALALAAKFPAVYPYVSLFHSTALADSEEKKASRNNVIAFIERNGVEAFTGNFITPLFADPAHPAIPTVQKICLEAAQKSVIAYTKAMRDRVERITFLKSSNGAFHWIVGTNDPGISVESIENQCFMPKNGTMNVLSGVGHMGMFEALDASREFLVGFSARCYL